MTTALERSKRHDAPGERGMQGAVGRRACQVLANAEGEMAMVISAMIPRFVLREEEYVVACLS